MAFVALSSDNLQEQIRMATARMEIGRGEFGNVTVFRLRTGAGLIVKAMRIKPGADGSKYITPKQFGVEVEIMGALGTGNALNTFVLPMLGHFISPDGQFGCIVMPYMGMFTLRAAMQINALERFLSMDLVRTWLSQTIAGIRHAARAGITHSDMSPTNILLSEDASSAILVSWGLSDVIPATATHPTARRFEYRAPELFRKTKHSHKRNEKSVVWSLGCIMYEMFTYTGLFGDTVPVAAADSAAADHKSDTPSVAPLRQKLDAVKHKDARALLDRMLVADPAKRISLEECLAHPFLSVLTRDRSKAATLAGSVVFQKYATQQRKLRMIQASTPAMDHKTAVVAVKSPAAAPIEWWDVLPPVLTTLTMEYLDVKDDVIPILQQFPNMRKTVHKMTIDFAPNWEIWTVADRDHPRPTTLTGLEFSVFAGFKNLQTINLPESATDEYLMYIAGARIVHMPFCKKVTNAGLRHLKGVKRIDLTGCTQITDEGLSHLRGVDDISLIGCVQITDVGLSYLTGVKTIRLSSCPKITDTGLAHLHGVDVISLAMCTRITDAGLAHLGNAWHICLEGCSRITDVGLAHLRNATCLYLQGCLQITDKGLASLNRDVISIHLDGCVEITDDGLMYLKNAYMVSLRRCPQITERGFSYLENVTVVWADRLWMRGEDGILLT